MDEHPEAGFAEPGHPRVALGGGLARHVAGCRRCVHGLKEDKDTGEEDASKPGIDRSVQVHIGSDLPSLSNSPHPSTEIVAASASPEHPEIVDNGARCSRFTARALRIRRPQVTEKCDTYHKNSDGFVTEGAPGL